MQPPDLNWIDKRAMVHHDQFRAFKTCLDAVRIKIDNKSISQKELVEKLKSWEALRTDLFWLINNFENYQTLISFLRFAPLNKVDEAQRRILVMVVRSINSYLKISEDILFLSGLICKTDEIYLNLLNVSDGQRDCFLINFDGLISKIDDLKNMIVTLSKKLEQLPKEIII